MEVNQMSDLAATNCQNSCDDRCDCGNFSNCFWLILILLFCCNGNGCGRGRCDDGCGCESIIWLIILLSCCGNGNGFGFGCC